VTATHRQANHRITPISRLTAQQDAHRVLASTPIAALVRKSAMVTTAMRTTPKVDSAPKDLERVCKVEVHRVHRSVHVSATTRTEVINSVADMAKIVRLAAITQGITTMASKVATSNAAVTTTANKVAIGHIITMVMANKTVIVHATTTMATLNKVATNHAAVIAAAVVTVSNVAVTTIVAAMVSSSAMVTTTATSVAATTIVKVATVNIPPTTTRTQNTV